ncbi:HAD family hydrolase [Aurantiacibacter rhizosphaerae]|uniref:HAD family hydrolase n=1 Tax=Aurantiacibacter rhizosphaerae TaxID=2691582 RepID=A0A844XGB3_9SPHN|nr:HAD family hydrolase [Aurantiacibacter rhizosphaerae]MWV28773.1 HAD family hydrolase [Aurantiacibacter rhizosphaerae]
MSRPLVVTDCDEVLLHMVRHFREWLDTQHDIEFQLEGNPFVQSMQRRGSDEALAEKEVWALLGGFFDTQMNSQLPIEGSVDAIAQLQRDADVVVLTNLTDARNEARQHQLKTLGIDAKVFTNQGPKGEALKRIVEEHGSQRAVFIDDLAQHHQSAFETVPHVHRLHFCGEPAIAPHIPCAQQAGHANARIDNWADALPWIQETLHGETR